MEKKIKKIVSVSVCMLLFATIFAVAGTIDDVEQITIKSQLGLESNKKHKEIGVEIHVVKDSKITMEQIEKWLEKANEVYNCSFKFVIKSRHNHTAYNNSKNDNGTVNIWGMDEAVVTGEPRYVSGQSGNIVELVPGKTDPDGTNVYIKNSTLAHELGHVLGLDHVDDPDNVMHPDNHKDPKTGKYKSCNRTGTENPPEQQNETNSTLADSQVASDHGCGHDAYDTLGDVGYEFVDLVWTEAWIEWVEDMYCVHLTASLLNLSFYEYESTWIGFNIESDNNPETGDPHGLDYIVGYNPAYEYLYFMRCDDGYWIQLDPSGISFDFIYTEKDLNASPIPTGVSFTFPLLLLERQEGKFLSYKVVADSEVDARAIDMAPDVGLDTIMIPPVIEIVKPMEGYLYIFDREIIPLPWTIIIGPITVEADVYDINGIDRVEFLVDDVVKATVSSEPFSWIWKMAFFKHTIKVAIYDLAGGDASKEMQVWKFL